MIVQSLKCRMFMRDAILFWDSNVDDRNPQSATKIF